MDMKNIFLILIVTFFYSTCFASSDKLDPKIVSWPFDGVFGKFDRQAAQRGFQVFKEVCSSCHSISRLSYRNLQKIGFSAEEVKQIASEYEVIDGPNDKGEMYSRKALLSDSVVPPYKNEEASRYANNGAHPVDLSLIIKARHDGANYVYSVLTGYQDAPAEFKLIDGLNYNPYFNGKQIAMMQPLQDGQVNYIDGTKATIDQMSRDVVVFLQWVSEPEMEHRKSMGLKVLIFLTVFVILFGVLNKRVWKGVE